MMWEIYGLKIINSLYQYYYIKQARLSNVEFTKLINESLFRLFQDIETFKQEPSLNFIEFGTRRSLSTDYQRLVLNILSEQLPDQCVGTSNVLLSREAGQANPKGTNAHELRMIPTALVDDPQEIIDTMYQIDRQWAAHFPELSILLPDTYGTSFYLEHCPQDIAQNHV
ncbi:MAG: hypothetical protein H6765_08130 [Candidatus Peribacteria bacterium]|nr:MAG: hypothetical protein H6765_08130 [Candidatus Peribacteria bacterium]